MAEAEENTNHAEKTIHGLVERVAATRAAEVAIYDGTATATFQQLNTQADQLARKLRQMGVQVGVSLDGYYSVVAILAILKLGRPYLPLDPTYPLPRIKHMCTDTQTTFVVTNSEVVRRGLFSEWFGGKVLQLGERFWQRLGTKDDATPLEHLQPSLAYVVYTSGSTGQPRGVKYLQVLGTHSGIVARFQWMWQAYPFELAEIGIQKTSYNFLDSLWETFGLLGAGVPLVIASRADRRDIGSLVRLMRNYKSALPSLRVLTTSGGPVSWMTAESFGAFQTPFALLNLYGATETSADATCYEVPIQDSESLKSGVVPIGFSLPNCQILLLDPATGTPVEDGAAGEIVVLGIAVAEGYFGRTENDRFMWLLLEEAKPCQQVEQHWRVVGEGTAGALWAFKTGDFGRKDEGGCLHYEGRRDQQVKVRGQRVNLLEVEEHLNRIEIVAAGCVLLVDNKLVAFVAPKQCASAEVIQAMASRVPAAMVPSRVFALEALPLQPTGKPDKERMASIALTQDPPEHGLSVSEWLRAVLCAPASAALLAWLNARVGGELVDPRATLTMSGLDSMDIMTLKLKLQKEAAECVLVKLDTALLQDTSWAAVAQLAISGKSPVKRREGKFAFAPEVAVADLLERDVGGRTDQYRVAGVAACAAGDVEAVRHWVEEQCWKPQAAIDKNGSNGLMWAAGGGHLQVVPSTGQSACMLTGRTQAAKAGHLDVINFLLESSCDASVLAPDGSGLFEYATLGGSVRVLEFLKNNVPAVNIHNRNSFGCTSVHWASAAGNLSVCQWLLEAGFDFDLLNYGGHGAVNVAAFKGHKEVLEWLLVAPDGPLLTAQLQTTNKQGITTVQELREREVYPEIADWLEGLDSASNITVARALIENGSKEIDLDLGELDLSK